MKRRRMKRRRMKRKVTLQPQRVEQQVMGGGKHNSTLLLLRPENRGLLILKRLQVSFEKTRPSPRLTWRYLLLLRTTCHTMEEDMMDGTLACRRAKGVEGSLQDKKRKQSGFDRGEKEKRRERRGEKEEEREERVKQNQGLVSE